MCQKMCYFIWEEGAEYLLKNVRLEDTFSPFSQQYSVLKIGSKICKAALLVEQVFINSLYSFNFNHTLLFSWSETPRSKSSLFGSCLDHYNHSKFGEAFCVLDFQLTCFVEGEMFFRKKIFLWKFFLYFRSVDTCKTLIFLFFLLRGCDFHASDFRDSPNQTNKH